MSVGERVRPHDWVAKTTGGSRYVLDQAPPDALWTAIVRSPYPHGRIVSCDVSDALRLPGVHAVITADDFGDRKYDEGTPFADRPPLARGEVRFIGQEVAAVAAETQEIARQAAALVRVRYRRLRAATTVAKALQSRAPLLHRRSTGEPNVSVRDRGEHGDFAAAARRATVRVDGTFTYPRVAQAPMEPSACLASWDPTAERLELWTTTQSPLIVTEVVADLLGLRRSAVVCREVPVGGGFGARSRVCEYEVLTAMLSLRAGRPVVTAYTREEEFTSTRTRHGFSTTLAAYADGNGRIDAFDAQVTVENGAYNVTGPIVMSVALHALGGLYRPTAVRWDARLVDTAVTPGGQMRGLGYPQIAMASECLVDQLAEAQALDPVQYRIQNANHQGQTTLGGGTIGSTGLVECLERASAAIGWKQRKADRQPFRGVGIAAGVHGSGDNGGRVDANRADAAIDVFADGRIRVRYGSIDFGTHQRTVIAQIVSEVLGVAVGDIEVVQADTELTPFELGQWGSRGTYFAGHALRECAEGLAERLLSLARADLGEGAVLEAGHVVGPRGRISLGELARRDAHFEGGRMTHEVSYVDPIISFDPSDPTVNDISGTYSFAAHAVEVEIDPDTGRVEIVQYAAAHGVGRALNPGACEGQIVGGVVMGLGAVLGEELITKDGRLVNASYLNYALPRAADVPDVEAILVEGYTDNGPWGAKSVGELPTVLGGPAVLNAIYDAIGVRLESLPVTPDKVLEALRERDGRPRRRYHLLRRPDRWQIDLMRRAYPYGVHWLLHRFGRKVAHRARTAQRRAVSMPTTMDALVDGARDGQRVLGGGTDVRLQERQGLIPTTDLVSVSRVEDVRRIEEGPEGGLEIGAAVTLAELVDDRRVPPVVREAAATIASDQIRNVATVAGNLLQAKRCWFYRNDFDCYKRAGATAPCYAVTGDHRFFHAAMGAHRCQAVTPSDLATALNAVNAQVVVMGKSGRRVVPVDDLYAGPGEARISDGEVVEKIFIGASDCRRIAAFEKLALWTGDFAIVSVAIAVPGPGSEGPSRPRVVVGAIAPTPWRAARTERALEDGADAAEVVRVLDEELSRHGHPLQRNEWKLDAARGIAKKVVERIEEMREASPHAWSSSRDRGLEPAIRNRAGGSEPPRLRQNR